VATEDTVECLSVEGRAEPVDDDDRLDAWVERYLAKYQPISPGISGAFIRRNLVVQVTPERAVAVIEREDEFSTRSTRWVFTT
jgi:hypothetical protein